MLLSHVSNRGFWTSILHEEFPKQTSSHILNVFFKNSGSLQLLLGFLSSLSYKSAKANFLQQNKFENITLINRKKEEAAKQLYFHYIDKGDDGEVIGGIGW